MLPLLFLPLSVFFFFFFFFAPHVLMHAWRRKGKRGWRGSAHVAVCLFVCTPCVGSFCWRASVCVLAGWTSASCPAACAVTQWIPRRQELRFSHTTSRLGQRNGDTTRREVQTSEGLRGTRAQAHARRRALAVRQTGCSCFWTLMCRVNQHTAWANYRLPMKLSGGEQVHTQRMHVRQNLRHCRLLSLFIIDIQNTDLSC